MEATIPHCGKDARWTGQSRTPAVPATTRSSARCPGYPTLSAARARDRGFGNPAKSPIPLAILGERLCEGIFVEIGPEAVDEMQLRVGAFPEQEVAEALLAAGADQEIDVG